MGQICYGCTREKILDIVAKIVQKKGGPNPFVTRRPGHKWWSLFKKRNSIVSLPTPGKLKLVWAKCCTPEILSIWYSEFKIYLEEHNLLDKTTQIWKADEVGFPLCATSGKVLSICNCHFKVVQQLDIFPTTLKYQHIWMTHFWPNYLWVWPCWPSVQFCRDEEQNAVMCAVSASGEKISPMQVFSGMGFKYKTYAQMCQWGIPLSFSNWLEQVTVDLSLDHKSFCQKDCSMAGCSTLVNGHAWHIDLYTTNFCRKDQILLYCLPPYSSHLNPTTGYWFLQDF